MKVTAIEPRVRAEFISRDPHQRTEGLHLGAILDDVQQILEGGGPGGGGGGAGERASKVAQAAASGWNLDLCAALGFAWERLMEDALSRALAAGMVEGSDGVVMHPGEIEVDGVLMTPDGFDPHEWTLEEYKCQWKSSRTPVEKQWRYLTQVKAYCWGMETTRARLFILHIMGNYRDQRPVEKAWELEFQERELEENWRMLTGHARSKGWL